MDRAGSDPSCPARDLHFAAVCGHTLASHPPRPPGRDATALRRMIWVCGAVVLIWMLWQMQWGQHTVESLRDYVFWYDVGGR